MSSSIRPRQPQQPQTLIDFAQEHERAWGNESYMNRPTLAEILNATVVVFWKPVNVIEEPSRKKEPINPMRETITIHQSMPEVEQFIAKMIFRVGFNPLDKQLIRIFHQGKRIKLKGVKILFEVDEPSDNDF
jgi:hypothetical protein